jgi:4-amino-4-deoxy-L-arabinose transferase-like glycosyltransferase
MGDVLAPSWETLARARLGPMVLVSLVSGALFSFVARRWGWWAGVATAGAWILQPRLFGHWHYAHFDNVLVSLWVASVLAFAKAVERDAGDRGSRWPRWPWVLLFGVLWGGAAGTKLTGWFLPFPYLAWVLLYRSRRGFIALLLGGLVAVVVLYAMIPPWWQNPVAGVERFLRSNLTRDLSTKIPTLFLGEIYLTPAGSLPWYNTLVWTLFVTPVGFLILALLGVSRAVRRGGGDPICGLAVIHWAFLLGLRALPHTPGHDGERQFLAAFGLLALAAGAGAAGAIERLGRWGKGLVIAAVVEGAVSLAVMMPFLLSYYSPVVGGLPGAVSLGMEATYYWDSLTDEAIEWLNTHTKPGEKVVFPTYPTAWRYLRQSGKLHPATQYQDPGRWAWYVVQNRGGALGPVDHELIDRIGPEHVLVSKFGVPLLWVFPYRELERARSVVEGKPGVR